MADCAAVSMPQLRIKQTPGARGMRAAGACIICGRQVLAYSSDVVPSVGHFATSLPSTLSVICQFIDVPRIAVSGIDVEKVEPSSELFQPG